VRLPPFQTLVDAHAAELHRFLVASIGVTDAEDCLQETLLAALRAYPRLKDDSNLRAWLYTIAQNKATDAARRRGRRRADSLDRTDGDGSVPRAEPSVAAHEPADDGLWTAVRALPPKQRAAVVHRFVFDLAYAEIGERIGCSEEAARQNVAAGLKRLRREVTE
jgi:RNA polymerase sigma factor (sigma-70 family)